MSSPDISPERLAMDDRSSTVLGCAIAFLLFNTLIISVRVTTSYLAKLAFKANDYVAVASYVFTLLMICVILAMVENGGLGRHSAASSPETNMTYGKLAIAYTILYFWASGLPKVAILLMYFRIFNSKTYRRVSWTLIGLVIAYCFSNTFTTFASCTPFAANWDPELAKTARCIDINSWWRWSTLPNSILDIVIMLLPIPQVIKLSLPLRDRLGLVFIFTAGGAGFATSIVRLVFFIEINGVVDTQWNGVNLIIAALVETGTYMVVISLPALRTLLLYARHRDVFSKNAPYSKGSAAYRSMPKNSVNKSSIGTDAVDAVGMFRDPTQLGMRDGSYEEILVGTQSDATSGQRHDSLPLDALPPSHIRVKTDLDVSSDPTPPRQML